MALTRRLLKDMELNDETIERIIAAHAETVTALQAQAAGHENEAQRIQGELDAFRRQVESERTGMLREQALQAALRRAGANEHAVPLLARTLETREDDWDGDRLRDEGAFLSPVRAQYAAFFSQPQPIPTDRIAPPLDGGMLSLEDVRRMSAEEINRNWSQVCSALHPHI